jgi:CHRD domain-containing protein/PEP-CTERM motif-containing protein
LDLDLFTLRIEADFSALIGTTTAAHIHATTLTPLTGTAGVATQTPSFEGFPLGVTSGIYDHTFDLTLASTYNPAFITANGGTISGASNALIFALEQGKAYFNIHTTYYPGGEIRGFLVPEPATVALLVMGGIGLLFGAWTARRR